MKHCIGIHLMSREEICQVIIESLKTLPYYFRCQRPPWIDLTDQRVGFIFHEPSSRTSGSFFTAAEACGFRTSHPVMASDSSFQKGEPVSREMTTAIQQGNDVICIRTKIEGAPHHLAFLLSQLDGESAWTNTKASIINGGDGKRNHPTQILLDAVCIVLLKLFKIRRLNNQTLEQLEREIENRKPDELEGQIGETLDNLKIAFVGDLRFSRVVSSWLDMGTKFKIKFILVAPPPFQVDNWRLANIIAAPEDELIAALEADITYVMRTQKERLANLMTEVEADHLMRLLIIGAHYISQCNGVIFHAQPLHAPFPMIDPDFWYHEKILFDMQAAMGPITRMAIFYLCRLGAEEKMAPLAVPTVEPFRVTDPEPILEHQKKMAEKWAKTQRSVNPLNRGMVLDHLPPSTGKVIDRLLERAGVYGLDDPDGIIVPNRTSPQTRIKKDILFLEDRFVAPEVLAALMLVAPAMQVVELKGDQYRKLVFALPPAVARIFNCPNKDCVTRIDPQARSFFTVQNEEPEIHLHCTFCRDRFTRSQILSNL